jgi:hypothetical protein
VLAVGRSTLPMHSCSASCQSAASTSTRGPLLPGSPPAISRLPASRTSLGALCHGAMAMKGQRVLQQQRAVSRLYTVLPLCCSGQLQSAVTCGGCGAVSHCFEDFLDLSLPIPAGRKASIQVHWRHLGNCCMFQSQSDCQRG